MHVSEPSFECLEENGIEKQCFPGKALCPYSSTLTCEPDNGSGQSHPGGELTTTTDSDRMEKEPLIERSFSPAIKEEMRKSARNGTDKARTVGETFVEGIQAAVSLLLSWSILLIITTIALFETRRRMRTSHCQVQEREEERHPGEKISQDARYYIERWGYRCQTYDVVTADGYVLRMYRIIDKETRNQKKRPVLVGHGLFQCSGDFVLNEEGSLAFVLAKWDYDVWLGNTRATLTWEHDYLSHKDKEYWAWGLKELGLYDWVAMIDFVRQSTGYEKIAYIGHSQGNAQAFVGLKLQPNVAEKLSCFIALAPAVFAGILVNRFPLKQLIALDPWKYKLIFGTASFLPIMSTAQQYLHPVLFAELAYSMFSYLFSWSDRNWLLRRKQKYFQFTPKPVSAQLIADWLEGWGKQGVCMYVTTTQEYTPLSHASATDYFPPLPAVEPVPLTVLYGADDYLVDGDRFVRTFEGFEDYGRSSSPGMLQPGTPSIQGTPGNNKTVGRSSLFPMLKLVHAERIQGYEHMDTIWAHDNGETTYPIILKALQTAQWDDNENP